LSDAIGRIISRLCWHPSSLLPGQFDLPGSVIQRL